MPVKVRILGDLRRFIDSEIVEVDGAGCSSATALDELVRRYPRVGTELFDDKGRLHYAIFLRANGRPVAWPQDKDEPIDDGGELLLTRFHSGG